ncbi:UNKNOWN [Stylonychia lemnae]|uniref:Transmembrane protein n=1 Tax=Stylonychia lemnae TaxID=5949 RepID=A0A078AUF9_STYLE|nr:UNKNOWN [Stylonychia lemnae]|eukprot:CDW84862.1 UNKNOWN [Stylonychia lemnae]
MIQNITYKNIYSNTGGLINIKGDSNVTMTGMIAEQCISRGNGTMIYASDQDGKIILQLNGVINITTVKSQTGFGGVFYVNGQNIYLSSNALISAQNLSAQDGSFIYSENSQFIEVRNALIQNITNGQVFFSKGQGAILLSNNTFECMSKKFEDKYVQLAYMQTNPVISNFFQPTQKSPLIIINSRNVMSSGNKIRQCYQSSKGGAIYLENTTFNDSMGSNFSFNSALEGGVIYCKYCKLQLNETIFQSNFANLGGSIYLYQISQLIAYRIQVRNSTAYQLGGFIYQNSTDTSIQKILTDDDYDKDSNSINFTYSYPFIRILDRSNIRYTYALQQGGSYYIQANNSEFYIEGMVNQSDSLAINYGSQGGIIRIVQADKLFISDSFFYLYNSTNGSVVASQCSRLSVFIRNSFFDQNRKFFFLLSVDLYFGDFTTGAISIEFSRKFVTRNNTYQNHFFPRNGGVIFSNMNSFSDFNSTYLNNYAVHGGVFRLISVISASVKNATFRHNRCSGFGGIFYLVNVTDEFEVEYANIYNTSANVGGVIVLNQPYVPFVSRKNSQIRMSNTNVTLVYGFNGAFGQFDGYNTTIIIEKSYFNMTLGGQFNSFKIDRAATFIINDLTVYNIFASVDSGFVYASNITEVLLVNNSRINCREPYFRRFKQNSPSLPGSSSNVFDWTKQVVLTKIITLLSVQQAIFSYNKISGCDLQSTTDAAVISAREFTQTIIDFSSIYEDINSIQNGIHYLNNTKIYMSNATFTNLSINTGVISTILTNIHIINSTLKNSVMKEGGFLYYQKFTYLLSKTRMHSSITNSTFQNITVADRGGLIFSDNYALRTIKLQSLDISQIRSGGTGGIIHLEQFNGTFKAGQRKNYRYFQAVDFYSVKGGQFLYSSTSPNLFIFNNTLIQCLAEGVSPIKRNLTNSDQIGVIFIADSVFGIQSQNATITRCLLSYQGPSINLINTTYTDYGSIFKYNNASFGSAIKCNGCNITMKNSIFQDSISNFGQILLDNQINALFENITAKNCTSQDGGIFYISKSTQTDGKYSYVVIKNSKNIFDNIARINGGFIFADNINLKMSLENIRVVRQKALAEGGLLIVKNAQEINISNSVFQDILSAQGAIISSESSAVIFSIKSSQFTCDSTLTDSDAISKFNISSPEILTQGYFFMQNAKNITIDRSTFSKCTNSLQGLFQLQKTSLYDYRSIFQQNSGAYGSILNSQESQSTFQFSQISNNMANVGGVFYVVQYSNVSLQNCKIQQNYAKTSAGVLYLSTLSNIQIRASDISQNNAPENSVLEILNSNTNLNVTIINSFINDNFALRNTISLTQTNIYIEKTQFKNNIAFQRSKNIICAFSNITIKDSSFEDDKQFNNSMMNQEITGAFIFLIFDVVIEIQNTKFKGGSANLGGAMYISGDSTVRIFQSEFLDNYSKRKGGALYASTFKSIYIGQSTNFKNNLASGNGDDVFVTNSYNLITFDSVNIDNPYAQSSIYIQQAQIYTNNLVIQNINKNQLSQNGAGINCQECYSVLIQNSIFKNLNSSSGGAIYLVESEFNKDSNSIMSKQKYQIINSTFESCFAQIGGAIYALNTESLIISGSNFLYNRAEQFKTSIYQLDLAGSGGAIYMTCNSQELNCLFKFQGNNKFTRNSAIIRGGAIYWDELEPEYFIENMIFSENQATQYGDNIACFSQKLGVIDRDLYKKQMLKLGLVSLDDFDFRLLNTISDNNNASISYDYSLNSQRSGGEVPVLYMALIDKYGQIVGSDFKSKVRIQIQTEGLDANASKYSPIIEGSTDFIATGGIAVIQDINIVGTPGSSYQMIVTTDGIDLNKKANKEQLAKTNKNQIDLDIVIDLRDCLIGEQFTNAGKCVQCQDGYSLAQQYEPGVCTQCPSQRAVCLGGASIGPQPGYWRKNNKSETFITCLYQYACLGMIAPNYNPIGECSFGYQGILCADCQVGFSRSNDYECALCPPRSLNIFRLSVIFIGFLSLIVFMVRSTLNGASDKTNSTSIYTKILLNHFQLLMVVASFDFEWSQQIVEFFSTTKQIATISTQIFSFDCFLDDRNENKGQEVKQNQSQAIWNKAMSSIVILLFLAHPSIVQYSFSNFKCKNIEGDNRVLEDLEIICWEQEHLFFTNFFSIPAVIVWGAGIPLFAYLILLKDRFKLENLDVRQKYGFLYRGYRTKYFYWEIVIMYRKIIIIIIAVFKKPFIQKSLNNLETLSLITSMVTVYCGVFFIINKPQKWINQNPDYSKGAISLSVGFQRFFFSMILIANLLFLIYWAIKFQQELRSKFREKLTKIYLAVFLCFNRDKLKKEFEEYKIKEMNLTYEDKFLKYLQVIKDLRKTGKFVLNKRAIERIRIYFGKEAIDKLLRNQRVVNNQQRKARIINDLKSKQMQKKKSFNSNDQKSIDEQLEDELTIRTDDYSDELKDYFLSMQSSYNIKKPRKISDYSKQRSNNIKNNKIQFQPSFKSDQLHYINQESLKSGIKLTKSISNLKNLNNAFQPQKQKAQSPNIVGFFSTKTSFLNKQQKTEKQPQLKQSFSNDQLESRQENLLQEETIFQSQNDEIISNFSDDNENGFNLRKTKVQEQDWLRLENEILQNQKCIFIKDNKANINQNHRQHLQKKAQNYNSMWSLKQSSQNKRINQSKESQDQHQIRRNTTNYLRNSTYNVDEIDINKVFLDSQLTDPDQLGINGMQKTQDNEEIKENIIDFTDNRDDINNENSIMDSKLYSEVAYHSSIEGQTEQKGVQHFHKLQTKLTSRFYDKVQQINQIENKNEGDVQISIQFQQNQNDNQVTDENRLQTEELCEFDQVDEQQNNHNQ